MCFLFQRQFKLMVSLFSVALFLSVTAASAAESLSIDKAVSEALVANPGLAAITARAKALAEVPDQVNALPDPSLSINLVNLPLDSFSLAQEGMTQFQFGLSQMLPYPGKLALRSQIASHEANAAFLELDEVRLQLLRDVKIVWWNIFYLDRALEVIDRNRLLLTQFVSVAETRYTVGKGLQQDILLAQLELSKLGDNTIRITNLRENEAIRLNILMDHAVDSSVFLPELVDEVLPMLLSTDVLQQKAAAGHPSLAAQNERMGMARTRVDLAKKDYNPDFKVGAVYALRDGNNLDGSARTDFGSILFSMNLPFNIGNKIDHAIEQRKVEWMQQRYRLKDQHNQVALYVQQSINDYQGAGEQVQLFKQVIIPQARQTVDAMLAGYQVSKVDFLDLIRSQTTLYNYETQYWKAISSANQALARLVAAIGEENIYE